MPGARLNLAVVHQNTGRPDLAEAHYLAALRIDPDFTPARANLSQLYNADRPQRRRRAGARPTACSASPRIGELQYSLGLLLAEEQRLPEAAKALGQAAQLLPERAKVHYNLGLALQQLGRREPAEQALLRAQRLDPQDAATVYALAVFYAQGGQARAGAAVGREAAGAEPRRPAGAAVRRAPAPTGLNGRAPGDHATARRSALTARRAARPRRATDRGPK